MEWVNFLIKIRKVPSIRSLKNIFKKTNKETLLKNTLKKDYCGDLLKLKNRMKWVNFLIKIRKVPSMRSLKNTLKKTNREILLKDTLKKDYCGDLLKLKGSTLSLILKWYSRVFN